MGHAMFLPMLLPCFYHADHLGSEHGSSSAYLTVFQTVCDTQCHAMPWSTAKRSLSTVRLSPIFRHN